MTAGERTEVFSLPCAPYCVSFRAPQYFYKLSYKVADCSTRTYFADGRSDDGARKNNDAQ